MRVHISELVRAMRCSGHEVLVVGPSGPGPDEAGQSNKAEQLLEAVRRRLPRAVFEAAELLYNLYAYARLSRSAHAFRPDIIYERHNLYLLAGLYFSRWNRLPLILEVNAPLASERSMLGELALRHIAGFCERLLWRKADIVLPVTHVLAEKVMAARGARGNVTVIHNGVRLGAGSDEQDWARVRRRYSIDPDAVVVGFAGFIRTWHGVEWALEVLRDLPPNIHLLIVGDGPGRPILQEHLARHGTADRVHITGRLPHTEVASHVAAFDIAVQPAAVPYASPLKLMEYMAFARAIIAPDQPNIREILTNGKDALLFTPGDAVSFRNALITLCTDSDLRGKLGIAARNTIDDRGMTWEANTARIAALAYAMVDAEHV